MEEFKDITPENIPWLTTDIIVGANSEQEADLNDISMYTRQSELVGAFVDVTVQGVPRQLQRVISRCGCEFKLVNLDDELDPVAEEYMPATPMVICLFSCCIEKEQNVENFKVEEYHFIVSKWKKLGTFM